MTSKPSMTREDAEAITMMRDATNAMIAKRKDIKRRLQYQTYKLRAMKRDEHDEETGWRTPGARLKYVGLVEQITAKEDHIKRIDAELKATERRREELKASCRAPISFVSNLITWAHDAEPGDRAVYYVGFAARDVPTMSARALQTVDTARSLYRQGAVTLTQRRLEPGRYEYIAVKLAGEAVA